MSKVVVLHHLDWDGWAAAWAIKQYYFEVENFNDINFIELTSSNNRILPDISLMHQSEVWIVDFYYPVEEVRRACEVAKNVMYIDHHLKSIDEIGQHQELRKLYPSYNYVIDSSASGALLTYREMLSVGLGKDRIEDQFIKYVISSR